MYTCLSFHHSACTLSCPGCYLKKRPTHHRKLLNEELRAILSVSYYAFGILEFAAAINNGLSFKEWTTIAYLLEHCPMTARRVTTSSGSEVGSFVVEADDEDQARERRNEAESKLYRGLKRITELFVSIDGYREGKLRGAGALVHETFESWTATPLSLHQEELHKGVAILLTPATASHLSKLINSVEKVAFNIDEYYLITPRGLPLSTSQIQKYNKMLHRELMRLREEAVLPKLTFDHCTIMSINKERCGEEGLLDIDEFGGIRTCVYNEQPDFYLDEKDPVGHFTSFLESASKHKLLKDYAIEGADCNACPILHKKRSVSNVTRIHTRTS